MRKNVRTEYFDTTISKEFFDTVCGELLGYGIGRHVYEMRGDPSKVIKFEVSAQSFQNIIEWETWEETRCRKESRWLAPCVRISPCGTILVMERTSPIPAKHKLPARVPAFLSDFKHENYGMLNGRLVCHDYGTNLTIRRGSGCAMKALGKRLSA